MRAPNILPAVIYTAYAVLGGIVVFAVTAHVDRALIDLQVLGDVAGYAELRPCRVAAPSLSQVLLDLGVYSRDTALLPGAVANATTDRWRYAVVKAFCRADTNAERAAALATLGGATSADAQVCAAGVRGVVTAAGDEETWLHGKQRLRKAYVRAHPAFYHEFHAAFVASPSCLADADVTLAVTGVHPALYAGMLENEDGGVAQDLGGDASTPCETAEAASALQHELYLATDTARVNGRGGGTIATADALVRLMLLAVVDAYDRIHNEGRCAAANGQTTTALCAAVYDTEGVLDAGSKFQYPLGWQDGTGSSTFAWPPSDGDGNAVASSCPNEWTTYTEAACGGAVDYDVADAACADRDPLVAELDTWESYARTVANDGATNAGAREHCIRVHSVGPSEVDTLFGMPDIDRRPPSGALADGGIGWSFVGDGAFDGWYVQKRTAEAEASPRIDAVFNTHYRLALELFYTVKIGRAHV